MALMLTDENGNPLSGRITSSLDRVLPRFRRRFPRLNDEAVIADLLEETGRRIHRHEDRHGPVKKLHGFAWTILHNIAISYLRRADGSIERNTDNSLKAANQLAQFPARLGNPEDVEQRVFYREVLEQLSQEERSILIRKQAGYSSKEIAAAMHLSASRVDQIVFRTRQKLKRLLGGKGEKQQ